MYMLSAPSWHFVLNFYLVQLIVTFVLVGAFLSINRRSNPLINEVARILSCIVCHVFILFIVTIGAQTRASVVKHSGSFIFSDAVVCLLYLPAVLAHGAASVGVLAFALFYGARYILTVPGSLSEGVLPRLLSTLFL